MISRLKTLLSLAAITVILFGGLPAVLPGQEFRRDSARGIRTSDVVNVDPADPTPVQRLYTSGFERVDDGPILRATLYVSQDFDVGGTLGSYSKSSDANALNMLFLEPDAPERWLFDSNAQLIYDTRSLSLAPIAAPLANQPEVALMLLMVMSDTNADQRLSETDTRSLAIVHPDGRGLVTLIEDLPGSVNILPDPSAIVLSVETGTGLDILRIDPTAFVILDRRTVAFPK